jgi:hypothetical protein
VINATGNPLDADSSGFFVSPIRDISTNYLMFYNPTSAEITYKAKTFIIDHPTDSERYLVHACLEGPEAGVYYRGIDEIKDGERNKVITLPPYASVLAKDFTVHVTPILDWDEDQIRVLNSTLVKNNQFKVIGDKGKFSWLVYGKRHDINVEPKKNEIQVKGDGPYKWH